MKKDKTPLDVSKFKGNRREKGEDFFSTPHQAIQPIIKYIPKEIKVIWECTAGSGNITKVLQKHGFKVIQTDINTSRQMEGEVQFLDFLTQTPSFQFDAIIFNPPFSYKTEFLKKALEYDKFFMFICPITILETKTRSKLYHENKLSIINLSNRIGYEGNYDKKPFFHSIWTLNDSLSKIHYEDLERYTEDIHQERILSL